MEAAAGFVDLRRNPFRCRFTGRFCWICRHLLACPSGLRRRFFTYRSWWWSPPTPTTSTAAAAGAPAASGAVAGGWLLGFSFELRREPCYFRLHGTGPKATDFCEFIGRNAVTFSD